MYLLDTYAFLWFINDDMKLPDCDAGVAIRPYASILIMEDTKCHLLTV